MVFDFCQKLRDFRQNADLTMEELSELSKISIGTILQIEKGIITNPRINTVVKLCNALGVVITFRQKRMLDLKLKTIKNLMKKFKL